MKLDNPKLTAFALGELSPAEQALLEPEIRSDREIAAEIEETREIARILRDGLGAEVGEVLGDHRRDAIFREVELLQKERSFGGAANTVPATQVFTPMVVPRGSLWERPGPWQAIAACAVAGFAAYALFINVGGNRTTLDRLPSGEYLAPVASDGGGAAATKTGEPNLHSPDVNPQPGSVAVEGFDALKKISSSPFQVPGWRDGASIGRSEKKGTAPEDKDVSQYLKERLAEATQFKEGSTYAEFAKVYRPSADAPGRFEMIRMPSIKVDAEFTTINGQQLSGESRLQKISKVFLD